MKCIPGLQVHSAVHTTVPHGAHIEWRMEEAPKSLERSEAVGLENNKTGNIFWGSALYCCVTFFHTLRVATFELAASCAPAFPHPRRRVDSRAAAGMASPVPDPGSPVRAAMPSGLGGAKLTRVTWTHPRLRGYAGIGCPVPRCVQRRGASVGRCQGRQSSVSQGAVHGGGAVLPASCGP